MTEEIIERIKELSLRDYVGEVPKNNKIICPKCSSGLKENRTPALHIYKNSGYCFSCNTSFNIVKYVQYSEGLYYWDAIKLLANMYDISTETLGKTWNVGSKTFFNKEHAEKYRKKLEMQEVIKNETAIRILTNKQIDVFTNAGKVNKAQYLSGLYVNSMKLFNNLYGPLHEVEVKYRR